MSLDQEKLVSSPIHGWIDGPESRPIKVDKWTRALVHIHDREHQVNRGYRFTASASTLIASAGGKIAYFINTNTVRPLISMSWDVTTAGILRAYAPSPRIYNPAADMGASNVQVGHSNTSGISICTSPLTTGATETSRRKTYMGSAGGPGGKSVSSGGAESSVLMALGMVVMFEITTTVDDCVVNFIADWSEQIPYDTPPLIVPV